MTVNETTSTGGGFKVFSIDDTRDLATAFGALINELETHHIPVTQVQFVLGWNQTTGKPIIAAIVKRH